MTTKEETATPPEAAPLALDWREIARTALGSAFVAGLIGGALHVLGKVIEAEVSADTDRVRDAASILDADGIGETEADGAPSRDGFADDAIDADDDAAEAAALLGVRLDATEGEIRAALRARLTESRAHPDHGGDGDEATRLIGARDLLVERARAVRL